MMRGFVLVACLLLIDSPAAFSATPPSPLQDLFQIGLFFAKVKDIVDLNLKAETNPVRCLNDTSQLATPKFEQCQAVFSETPTEVTSEAAQKFCRNHCGTYLFQLLGHLKADCQFPAGQLPGPSAMVLLQESCYRLNGNHPKFCIETWGDVDPNSASFNQDYLTCLENFDGQGACPDVCKRAEHWVASTLGCCYKAMADYVISQGGTEGILTEDYWNACGVKEPPSCISP